MQAAADILEGADNCDAQGDLMSYVDQLPGVASACRVA